MNIICATPSIDKTETRQNRRLTLGRRWEKNKAGNLFLTIQYRVSNIVSYTEFMVACMFQVKRFYSLSLPDSETLLLLLILCRAASSAALSHYDYRTLGDLEWEVESTTVTHSNADWWDILLPLA